MSHHDTIRCAMERTANTFTAFPQDATMTEDADDNTALAECLLERLEEAAPGKGAQLARHLYRRHGVAKSKDDLAGLAALDAELLETHIDWHETVGPRVAQHRLAIEYGLWVSANARLRGAARSVLRAHGIEGDGPVEGLVSTLKSEWGVESLHELDSAALDRRTAEVLADGWAIPVEAVDGDIEAPPLPSARAQVFEDITVALDGLGLTEDEQVAWSMTVGSDWGVDMVGCLDWAQARAVLALVRSMTREDVLRWGSERVSSAS